MIDIDIIQLWCNYIGKSAKENATFWRNQTPLDNGERDGQQAFRGRWI